MSQKWKFILTYGLGWGIFTFLGTSAVHIWVDHRTVTPTDGFLGLVSWSLVGLLFGTAAWKRKLKNTSQR